MDNQLTPSHPVQDPAESEVLANGAVRGTGGRIAIGAPLTSEQARALALARWKKHNDQVDAGLETVIGPDHSRAIGARLGHIIDSGVDRDAIKAIEVVNAMRRPEAREGLGLPEEGGLAFAGVIPAEKLPDIIQALIQLRRGDVVDGEAIEIPEAASA